MKPLGQRYIVILGIILAIVLLLPVLLDRPRYQTFDETAGWDVHTAFVANGEPDRKEFFPSSILEQPGVRFWTNYSRERGIFTGQVSSSFFVLKNCLMIIPVFGFPNSEEAGIYVESESDHRQFAIRDGAAPTQWQPATLVLPKSLLNTSVRIVAYSRSPQVYIGVGTPYYRSNNVIPGLFFSKLFAVALLSLIYLVILFFPVFHWLPRLAAFAPVERMLATLVLTSLSSVPLFFLAFYFPTVARLVVYLWLLLSGALILRTLTAGPRLARRSGPRCCLFILAALTVFQASFLFSFNMVSVEYTANYLFYPASWSVDNQIPTTTARLLAQGTVLRDWPFSPWRLSDRTPLLGTLLYPAAVITGNFHGYIDGSGESMFLQVCGFGIQNCWVLPVWIICRRLRLGAQECVLASLLLAATPFVFFNTVYLWPKLLTVTFCLAQYIYLVPPSRELVRPSSFPRLALGGTAAAMAVLAHAGSGMASLGIFGAAVYLTDSTRSKGPNPISTLESVRTFVRHWQPLLLSILACVLVLSPWLLWTKCGLPTSNPLPKYFLTGGFGFEASNEDVVHAVQRFYRTLAFKQWLTSKGLGLETLAGFYHGDLYKPFGAITDLSSRVRAARAFQFLYLLPSLGLLLIPIAALLRTIRQPRMNAETRRSITGLGIAVVLSFALQFALMMSPHLLHHYPYFIPFALHLLPVIGIVMWRECSLMRWSAVVNYVAFLFLWIVFPIAQTPVASMATLVLSLALVFAASILTFKLLFSSSRHRQTPALQA
jgi:hypothetical protein